MHPSGTDQLDYGVDSDEVGGRTHGPSERDDHPRNSPNIHVVGDLGNPRVLRREC